MRSVSIVVLGVLLCSLSFGQAQDDIGFGGGAGGGAGAAVGSAPALSGDRVYQMRQQLEGSEAVLAGVIREVKEIGEVSRDQKSGSRDGKPGSWTEITTEHVLRFEVQTTLRGKAKDGLTARFTAWRYEDDPPSTRHSSTTSEIPEAGQAGVLVLRRTRDGWVVANFLTGNEYMLAVARGEKTGTAYTTKQRLPWVRTRVRFFDSLARGNQILGLLKASRKRTKTAKRAAKAGRKVEAELGVAVRQLSDLGLTRDYVGVFEKAQADLVVAFAAQRQRLRIR